MSYTVEIQTAAEVMVVRWLPDGRALTDDAVVSCNEALIDDISLTVGGSAIACERLLGAPDMPVVDRGVVMAAFTLASAAGQGLAASVTLPAGLLSDGVESSPAATVTVENNAWTSGDIDALIGDDDLIYYLAKPTEGNDSTARAYTKDEIGGTPSDPTGENRFATPEALMLAVRDDAAASVVVRRKVFILMDQTGTWTTAAGAAFFDLQNTGGASVTGPLVIATFGDGTTIPKYDAAANKPFVRMRRVGDVRLIGPMELDGNLVASNLVLVTASTTPLDIAHIHLDRVHIHHAAGAGVQVLLGSTSVDTENDRLAEITMRRTVIEDCRGDGLSVSPGGNPPGIWAFHHDLDCVFRRNGSGSGSHNRYTKRVRWSLTRRLLGGRSTGSNLKLDKHRSHLIEDSILIRKGINIEANGDNLDGERTGREETSPGSVVRAVKMRRSTITDLDTDVAQWGIKSNSAIDCVLAEECIIDTVGSGPAITMLAKSGGGDGARFNADGRRSSASWNLIRVSGSVNGCGLRLVVPDTDTPENPGESAADVLGTQDAEWSGNILYGVAGAGALIQINNSTLAAAVSSGRASLSVTGCCLYHEDGDTKTVRENGVDKSRATAVSDGIIASSNRYENPGCADATRNVERYGREVLGLTGTRDEVLDAIEDVWVEDLIEVGAVRATYSQPAIHAWIFEGAIPTALVAANYPAGVPGPDRPVVTGRGLLALTDIDGQPFPAVINSVAASGVNGSLSVVVTNASAVPVAGLAFTPSGVATVTGTPPTTLGAWASTTVVLSLSAASVADDQAWGLSVSASNADTKTLTGSLDVTADAAAPDLELTLVGGPSVTGGTVDLGQVIEDTPAPWAVFARNTGNATMSGIVITATGDASLSTETEALPLALAAGRGTILRGVVVGAAGTVTGGLTVDFTGGSGSVGFTLASLAESEPILELQDDQGDPAPASVDVTAEQGVSPTTTVRIANTGTGTAEGASITLTATGVTQIVRIVDQGGQAVDPFDLGSYGIVEGGYWTVTLRNRAGRAGDAQAGSFGFTSPYGDGSLDYSLDVAEMIGGTGDGRNLWKIKDWMTRPSGHVAVINIADSNGAYQDQRWIGGVRAVYPVDHLMIPILPNTGGVGQTSGGFTQVINVGGAAISNSNFDPGDSVLGTSGLLTGLASNLNRYPRRGLKARWVSDPANPHFSRWCIPKMTHGEDMQTAAAVAGQNYAGGDPSLNKSMAFGYACLGNTNGNAWSMQMQSDLDPEGDDTWGTAVTHGYSTDADVAADDLKIIVVERSGTVNSGLGMSARLKHTATDEATDRTGRQMYLLDTWFTNTELRNGLSFWSIAVGGWNTTDHMESTVDGVANTDSKYDTDRTIEWVRKVVRPDRLIIRIQLGQNNTAAGDFYEGSGTDTGVYGSNIQSIISRWRTIAAAVGVPVRFYLVASQNTISGGARFAALATVLRNIADNSTDVKFFDLRKALIDEGYTDSNQLMLSTVSTDGIHTNQNGMFVFAQLEWGAINAARPGGGRRPRVNARKRLSVASVGGD